MTFGILILGDMVLLLYGSPGMIEAAKQYCEQRDDLDLADYMEWVIQHKLLACVCVKSDIKEFLRRFKIRHIAKKLNDMLLIGQVFIRPGMLLGKMKAENKDLFDVVYPKCFLEKMDRAVPDTALEALWECQGI